MTETKTVYDARRFTKIGPDGQHLPADAKAWEAVLDPRTGLMWPEKSTKVKNYAAALKVPAKLKVAGFTDWRMPTVEELFLLADRTRMSPAIDTEFFPDTKNDWYWTSTLHATAPAECAWVVHFYYGGLASYNDRDYDGFVRAVRGGQ